MPHLFLDHVLRRVGYYSPSSLHLYIRDYLGLHSPFFRKFLRAKKIRYGLQNGIKFVCRPFTCDRCIIDEIFIENMYTSPPGFDIHNNYVVVDLGADIGIFTVFAATRAENVKVYSYEPLPSNVELLRSNLLLNGVGSKVNVFSLAVHGKKGYVPLYVEKYGLTSLHKDENSKTLEVKSILLEDVISFNNLDRIDFLKVDVEGAEWEIFSSTGSSYLQKIMRIAMECHSPKVAALLTELLTNSGFHVQVIDTNNKCPYLFGTREELKLIASQTE